MKCRAVSAAVLLSIVLALFGLIISCGNAPGNADQNQGGGSESKASFGKDDACDETNLDTKIGLAQNKISNSLAKDNQLKDNRIKALVRKSADGDYLEVLIEGYAGGEDEVNDLTSILRKFMDKNCVLTVKFVPTGTIPGPSGTTGPSDLRSEDFQWSACEHPKVACPSGECEYPPCPRASPMPR